MLDEAVGAVAAELDAEAVAGGVAVGEPGLGLKCVVARRREPRAGQDADVPGGEVARGHRQHAGAEAPAGGLGRAGMRRAERVGLVAGGRAGRQAVRVEIHRAGQVQRGEDARPELVEERRPAGLLGDQRGDGVAGVGILPLGAGRKVERLAAPALGDRLRRRRHGELRRRVVLRPVVLVAGEVLQQHPDGDVLRLRQVRQVLRHLVVERELVILGEEQHERGGELLGDGADRQDHRRGERPPRG